MKARLFSLGHVRESVSRVVWMPIQLFFFSFVLYFFICYEYSTVPPYLSKPPYSSTVPSCTTARPFAPFSLYLPPPVYSYEYCTRARHTEVRYRRAQCSTPRINMIALDSRAVKTEY